MCTTSIIIATLGDGLLERAIFALNSGSVKPDEIILVIPEAEVYKVSNFNGNNIKIVVSRERGQVAQRALGFSVATGYYVMQLDDDIVVDFFCLERLQLALSKLGFRAAVGPALIDLATETSIYTLPKVSTALFKIYCLVMNGTTTHKPGVVDLAGSAVSFGNGELKFPSEVQWLAGGCVLHYNFNLIRDNYYPFTGKAYYEDVIHSYLLKQKGVRLFLIPNAICRLESLGHSSMSISQFILDMRGDLRARKYLMKMDDRSSWRMYLFYSLSLLGFFKKKFSKLLE